MELDPRHLVQLAAIVRHGSYAKAAAELNLAPSALTRNMQSLEKRVGGLVLDRNRRGARPTELGSRLADYGQVIRKAREQAEFDISPARALSNTTIKIGATQLIAENFLLGPLSEYVSKPNAPKFDLVTGEVVDLIRMVEIGVCDLALGQFGAVSNPEKLTVRPLVNDYLTVLGRRGHPALVGGRVSRASLQELDWILPRTGSRLRWQVDNALLNSGFSGVNIAGESQSMLLLLSMVERTDCVTMVPHFPIVHRIDRGSLVELLPSDRVTLRPINILLSKEKLNVEPVPALYRAFRRAAERMEHSKAA